MTDSTLSIGVDSTNVKTAAQALDEVTASAAKAETGATALENALEKVNADAGTLATGLKEVAQATAATGTAATTLAAPLNSAQAALNGFNPKNVQAVTAALAQTTTGAQATAAAVTAAIEPTRTLASLFAGLNPAALFSKAQAAFNNYRANAKAAADATGALGKQTQQTGIFQGLAAHQATQLSNQLQDFFVQVQAGGSPLTAFIQQGSQLGAVFGGLGNAAKTLGGVVLRFITNPYIAAAAAIAGFVASAYQGVEQARALEKQLALAGGSVGLTRGAFDELAKSIAASGKLSIGSARDMLSAFVATGEFTQESLGKTAEAAAVYSKATGKSLDDVTKQFAGVQDGVSKFANEIAKGTGITIFNANNLKLIKSLEDAHDKQGAVALTMTLISENARKLAGDLGPLDTLFGNISRTISDINQKRIALFTPETAEGTLARLKEAKAALDDIGKSGAYGAGGAEVQSARERLDAEIKIAQAKVDQNAAELQSKVNATLADAAARRINATIDAGKTKAEKLAEALANVRKDAAQAGSSPDELKKAIAATYEQFGKETLNKQDALNKAIADKALDGLKNTLALEAGELQGQATILESLHSAGLIDEDTYYAKRRANIQALVATEIQAHKDRIEYLKAEKFTGDNAAVEEVNRAKAIADEQTAMLLAEQKAGVQLGQLSTQRTGQLKASADAYEAASLSAKQYIDVIKRRADAEVAGIGIGDEAAQRMQQIISIQESGTAKIQAIQARANDVRAKNNGVLTAQQKDDFDKEVALARTTSEQEVAIEQDKFARIDKARADSSKGAQSAIENYITDASNVAELTKTAYTNAFSSIEDALVSFSQTGKINFKSLANSILGDLARIEAKAALSTLLKGASGSGGLLSLIGSAFTSLIGGSSSGGGSGGVDYSLNTTGVKLGGPRALGGPTSAGLTPVNEFADRPPELFESANGKQYLLAGAGSVDANAGGLGGDLNINVDASVQRPEVIAAIRTAIRAYDLQAQKKYARKAAR